MAGQVLVDANLIVLLVVGMASPDYIEGHKRLTDYKISDYRLLTDLLSEFGQPPLLVTSHILAEASNLLNTGGEPRRNTIMKQFVAFVSHVKEMHIPAATAIQRDEFLRLGLSDAALLDPGCGISEWMMPRPAVIHCTAPGVRSPRLPRWSSCSMWPSSM